MSLEWMQRRIAGYRDLPGPERDAMTAFFWLWSFFEGHYIADDPEFAHHENRAVPKIIRFVDNVLLCEGRQVDVAPFEAPLAYFRDRYFPKGVENPERYPDLRVQWEPGLVRDVLSGRDNTVRNVLVALLVVVSCLRNNTGHGPKWRLDLAQQRSNFENANSVIIAAMQIDERHLVTAAAQPLPA